MRVGFKKNVTLVVTMKLCLVKDRVLLRIDFIDGNRDNHRIDNLRLLCPNCYFSFNGQFPSSGNF